LSPAYAKRLASAASRGLTKSQARGHPLASEAYASELRGKARTKSDAAIQKALTAMKSGSSLAATAKAHKVSRERLSAYAKSKGGATYGQKRWSFQQRDRFQIPIIAKGRRNFVKVWVGSEEAAKLAGEHFAEARKAVENPILFPAFEKRWEGVTITDLKGRDYNFETDPNQIYRALNANEIDWSRIYQRLTN